MPSSVPETTLRTPAGPLVYTDVGCGPPLIFLHGNPTNASLYRHLIRDLSNDYRCIAPDYLGFGRSATPSQFSYRPPAHATLVETLIQSLELSDVTLVLHDWGGPIGTAYASRHPSSVRRVVLMNTWAWPLTHRPLVQLVSRCLGSPLGRLAIEHGNAFARLIMPSTTGSRAPARPPWLRRYAAALDSRVRRHACWAFARALHTETDWLRALWTRRGRLRQLPALLCWGMDDPAFGTEDTLRRWMSVFNRAKIERFPDTGHYVPEERGNALISPVRTFLRETD